MKQPDLTIVIPAFSEEKRIGKTLDELAAFIKKDTRLKDKQIEVIVVAADTHDKTHSVVEMKAHKFSDFKLLRPGPKAGKGRDVQYGMLHARGRAVIFMDADLATPLHHLPVCYQYHLDGHDVVIATRNLRKHHPNFWRRLLSNCGNLIFRIASGVWVEDSQCGFKLFSQEAAQACFSRLTIMGWGFDMEVLAIAKAQGLRTKTHRVEDWRSVPDGPFAKSSMFANSLKSLGELGYIFVNRLRRAYK